MAGMRSTDARGVLVGKPSNMKGLHSPAIGGLHAMSGKRNRGKGKMARPVGFAKGGLVDDEDPWGGSGSDAPDDSGGSGSANDVEALRAATERVIASNSAPPVNPNGGTDQAFLQPFLEQLNDQRRRMPDPRALDAQEDRVAKLQEGALNRQLAQSKSMGSGGINIPLLQASAALLAPTKAGSFGESLGAAGAAGAGALAQQRQMEMLQSDRESKLQDNVAKVQSDALERKRKTYETAQTGVNNTMGNMLKAYDAVNAKLKAASELNLSRERIAELQAQSRMIAQQIGAQNHMFTSVFSTMMRNNQGAAEPASVGDVAAGARSLIAGGAGGGGAPAPAPGQGPFPLTVGGIPMGSPIGSNRMTPQPAPGGAGAPPPIAPPGVTLPVPPTAAPSLVPGGAMPVPPAPEGDLIDERTMQQMEGGAPPVPAPVPAAPVPAPAPVQAPVAPVTPPIVVPPPAAPGANVLRSAPMNRIDQVAGRQQALEAYKTAKVDATRGKDAAIQESQLNTFKDALDRYDASGRTTAAQAAMKQAIGGALGIDDPGGVSDRDLMKKLSSQMTMTTASLNTKGVTSNKIEQLSGQSVPDIDTNSLAGNRKIIDYMMKLNDLDKGLADIATQWMNTPEPSKRPNYLAAREAYISDWAKRNAAKRTAGGAGGAVDLNVLRSIAAGKK